MSQLNPYFMQEVQSQKEEIAVHGVLYSPIYHYNTYRDLNDKYSAIQHLFECTER